MFSVRCVPTLIGKKPKPLFYIIFISFFFFLSSCQCSFFNRSPATNIIVNEAPSFTVAHNLSGSLTANVTPKRHTNGNVIWSSDNSNVFFINRDGKYKAFSVGTATVTAKVGSLFEKLTVKVISPDLQNANLQDSYLRYANLAGVNLSNASLIRANLSHAKLTKANLVDADMGIKVSPGTSADLSHADLSHADLRNVNLPYANLSGINLKKADLRNIYLNNCNLENANLEDANLSGANLTRCNLRNANLEDANLSGARLEIADLSNANLEDANLSGANLWLANFSYAEIKGLNTTGALNLHNVNWTGTKR